MRLHCFTVLLFYSAKDIAPELVYGVAPINLRWLVSPLILGQSRLSSYPVISFQHAHLTQSIVCHKIAATANQTLYVRQVQFSGTGRAN